MYIDFTLCKYCLYAAVCAGLNTLSSDAFLWCTLELTGECSGNGRYYSLSAVPCIQNPPRPFKRRVEIGVSLNCQQYRRHLNGDGTQYEYVTRAEGSRRGNTCSGPFHAGYLLSKFKTVFTARPLLSHLFQTWRTWQSRLGWAVEMMCFLSSTPRWLLPCCHSKMTGGLTQNAHVIFDSWHKRKQRDE